MTMLVIPATQAAPKVQGWGRVNMQGAIIDTACAIAAGSRDQTIDMDVLPLGNIARDGQGNTRPFTIELINCTFERPKPNLPNWKQFQV
ncbi:fimbrial protein, partial [Serratia marcescens]